MFWFLRKTSGKKTIAVNDAAIANSEEVDIRNYAGGNVTVSAGITLLTFYASQEEGGTYLPAKDQTDVAVTLTVSSAGITELPAAVYSFDFIKVLGDAAGTAYFSFKS